MWRLLVAAFLAGKCVSHIGLCSSELAVALAHHGEHKGLGVYQIFSEKGMSWTDCHFVLISWFLIIGNLASILPDYLSEWTSKQVLAKSPCLTRPAAANGGARAGIDTHCVCVTGGFHFHSFSHYKMPV